MKKIRILHITQSVGGVLRYIQMLLKYMDKEKFENIILCLNRAYLGQGGNFDENTFYKLMCLNTWYPIDENIWEKLRIKALLKEACS